MGVAYYVVLDRPVEGITASSVDGKALARATKQLSRVAKQHKVPDLLDFVSASPDEMPDPKKVAGDMKKALADLNSLRARLGKKPSKLAADIQKLEDLVSDLPPVATERWFDPKEGLLAVRGIANSVEQAGGDAMLAQDLRSLEDVLLAAQAAGARFHLSVDY